MSKELVSKLLRMSQEIDRTPKADYIHISEEFIQEEADKNNVSFDEMVKIIENELKPNN